MKNLFIDTNIWLSLYHFTNDDLEQFNKLKNYIGTDVKLFIPKQVQDEIRRNREAKLKDAFKSFEIKSVQYPAFCKAYEEFEAFNKDYNNLLYRYKEWKKKIDADIINKNLPADLTITDLFGKTGLIECDSYINTAYARYRIGNPPGKDNKYGDAINWECLLDVVPNGEDLYFISADKDYRSDLSDEYFNPFLAEEWSEKKGSKVIFYRNLVTFLNEHIKDIQLRTEQEKQELINKLSESGSFVTTHGVIAMLNKYSGWTDAQVEELCSIAENNTQVSWVLSDMDVLSFYSSLLGKKDYEKLNDCSTKRIMETIFDIVHEQEEHAREDFEADRMEALENNYMH